MNVYKCGLWRRVVVFVGGVALCGDGGENMSFEILSLPVQVQISLGSGYAAYVVAYSGLAGNHRARDVVFISFAFSAFASLIINSFSEPDNVWLPAFAALASTIVLAAVWRSFGRRLFYWLLKVCRVHGDDGFFDCWQSLVQAPGLKVGQIAVYTEDGRILWMNQRAPYWAGPKRGLELGSDGSVIMVVEEETQPDGNDVRKEDIVDPNWGTRLTYIPARSITRVNLRVK